MCSQTSHRPSFGGAGFNDDSQLPQTSFDNPMTQRNQILALGQIEEELDDMNGQNLEFDH